MIVTIVFAILLIIVVVALIAFLINGIALLVKHIRKMEKGSANRRTKKNMIVLVVAIGLCAGLVSISQFTASTPAISGENSIAELRKVSLNGREEWISIRGNDKNKPVLLFLAGGPGGSQMAAVRHDLAELEQYFVVVNWDQAGSGKSYGAMRIGNITVDTYIEDGYELTKYLCETFRQKKIYLVGESWGSALGIFLIDKAPELYHSFIGTGQMVSFLETEVTDYELAMEIARDKGDGKIIKTLEANGMPPYYGKDVTWKSAAYLNYLSSHMAQNPAIQNGGYNTFRDLFSNEYGLLDKSNYLRGIVNTFNGVYPQLYDVDLRIDYPTLEVPVYFFLGRHDVNAPTSLVEDYFSILSAPEKEIIWFEHSGHSPWINESERFVEEVLRVTRIQ
ncbi:alpha/beta hydrolase [Enterococcus florum]|uniref:Alpha/beta hydrolase n=1 Tax=Enterococcus florum TaxID=2480627 RepID=A0A4P5P4J4_9ENTE|nr:alpha/beta hydrolase [Enterococcus florum]GCF92735.1 alpha/beta hydrolase [Enterococcus florum]